eukprot:2996480-Amphidinium_carterae.2
MGRLDEPIDTGQVTSEHHASYAEWPLPEGFQVGDLFKFVDVPSDGNCMWYSSFLQARDWPQLATEEALVWKAHRLADMRANSKRLASMMGVEQSIVLDAIQTWSPPGTWADNRLLLLLAAQHEGAVLIVDQERSSLKLFCPIGSWSSTTKFWVFHHTKEHCSPGSILNLPKLFEILPLLELRPWVRAQRRMSLAPRGADPDPTVPSSHSDAFVAGEPSHETQGLNPESTLPANADCNGRPFKRLRRKMPVRRAVQQPKRQQTRLPQVLEHDAQIALTTWNIGGWTSHRDDVLASLLHDPPSVVALQELGMSVHAQAAASRFLRDNSEYDMLHFAPTPHKRTGKGVIRLAKGSVPGVGFLFHKSVGLTPLQPRTDKGATLQRNGRLCMALLQVSKKTCYMLINVYCPSGWDRERVKEREEVFATVLTEIQAHADVHMILLGDMNEYFPESLMAGPLTIKGWHFPLLEGSSLHEELNEFRPAPTYRCGDIESSIDYMCLSPDLACHVKSLRVCFWGEMQHARVSCPLSVGTQVTNLRVSIPHDVLKGSPYHVSDVDWTEVVRSLQGLHLAALREPEDNADQRRELLETAWEFFTSQFRRHLVHCHSFCRKGRPEVPCDGRNIGKGTGSHKPSRANQLDPSDCLQASAVHIVSLVASFDKLARRPNNHTHRTRLENCANELVQALRITHSDFRGMLSDPPNHTERMHHLLNLYRAREKHRAIKAWRRTLFHKGRPTASLYRWLKTELVGATLSVVQNDVLHVGPIEYFGVVRDYWSTLMNRSHQEDVELTTLVSGWCASELVSTDDPSLAIDLLCKAARSFKAKKASGLDQWPASAMCHITRDIACALY